MTIRFSRRLLPALPLLLAITPIPLIQAQPKSPNIRTIMRYTVRSDRRGDMAAAIKEYNAVLKKARWDKNYTIWRSSTGPTELVRVDYHDTWAELDTLATSDPKLKEYQVEMARITQRINDSVLASARVVDIVNREMSLPRQTDPPKMLMVWTAHVKQGKLREVIELEKNEYVPAVKNAGFKSYTFATTRFGGPNNEIRASTGLEKWADLDQANPIRKAMGDEKYRTFSEKMGSLLDDYRYEIFRFDPELSYTAAK